MKRSAPGSLLDSSVASICDEADFALPDLRIATQRGSLSDTPGKTIQLTKAMDSPTLVPALSAELSADPP